MKQNSRITKASIILIVIGIITSFIRLFMPSEFFWADVKIIFGILTLVFALIYSTLGYRKNANLFYKIFMLLYALNGLAAVLLLIVSGQTQTFMNGFVMAFNACYCLAAFMLTFVRNMGRKLSMALGIWGLLLNAFICVYVTATSQTPLSGFFSTFQTVVIAFLAVVFIVAKYEDKFDRKIAKLQ